MKTCILIPSSSRYAPLSRVCVHLLDRFWMNHPPVFTCGHGGSHAPNWLQPRVDESDWLGSTKDAVDFLLARGYDRCYLILDDQVPMAECHEEFLGETLPAWMDRLGANYIALCGWDTPRRSGGEMLWGEYLLLQRTTPSLKNRFALNPALWRLSFLSEALGRVAAVLPGIARPPHAFEKLTGTRDDLLPEGWQWSTYKVCGWLTRARRDRTFLGVASWARLACERALVRLARALPEAPGEFLLEHVIRIEAVFFDGPYPTAWSGAMLRGAPNPHIRRHCDRLAPGILAAIEHAQHECVLPLSLPRRSEEGP